MHGEALHIANAKFAAVPRLGAFLLLVPLLLTALVLASLQSVFGFDELAVAISVVLLGAALGVAWIRRRHLAGGLCLAAAAAPSILLLRQVWLPEPGSLTSPVAIESAISIWLAIAVALLTVRRHSKAYSALRVFISAALVQVSIGILDNAFADFTGRIPPLTATAFFILAIGTFARSMLRSNTRADEARIWPAAASCAALAFVLVSFSVSGPSLAAAIDALTGTTLVAVTLFACRAAVTRREMFLLHIGLERKMRNLTRQSAELQALHSDYAELLENVPIGVMRTRGNGQILGVNSRMCDILGYPDLEQLKVTDMRALFLDPDRRRQGFVAWLESKAHEWKGDVDMLRQDGSTIIAHFTSCRVDDAEGELRYVLSCYSDVTEARETARKKEKLETEMRLAHKLESVGRLAAGIGHEINTPMQYIGDNVHFLSSAYADLRALVTGLTDQLEIAADESSRDRIAENVAKLADEADLEYLDETVGPAFERTLEGVRSVSRIVRSMKEFAYPHDGQMTSQDVNTLLENTLTVSHSMYASVAEIETAFGEIPATYCFPGELNQAFVNLVVNAAHAVEAANKLLDRPMGRIRIATRLIHNGIEVTIGDNGIGMTKAVQERIFDPFFTTKEVGKGTGQGLAIVHSIITEKHGGRIEVASSAGEGTTFTILIPVRKSGSP